MKVLTRILGVLGLLILVAAIVACLMARQYKKAYRSEKAARSAEASVITDLLLSSVQESLLKASLAVNQGNFGDAKTEITAAKKNLATFSDLAFSKEMKETEGFSTSITEIEVDLAGANPEVQKKILSLAGTITDLLSSLNKSAGAKE